MQFSFFQRIYQPNQKTFLRQKNQLFYNYIIKILWRIIMKNYKVIFPAKNKVELVEWEMPEVGDNDILIKTEISLIF